MGFDVVFVVLLLGGWLFWVGCRFVAWVVCLVCLAFGGGSCLLVC